MFIGCPRLRVKYLHTIQTPTDKISARKAALKLSQLVKMKETISFDILTKCILFGDTDTHIHLLRHCSAYNLLVEGLHTENYKAISMLCLKLLGYSTTWLFNSSNSDVSSDSSDGDG